MSYGHISSLNMEFVLSHDILSGSDIKPSIKIGKPYWFKY